MVIACAREDGHRLLERMLWRSRSRTQTDLEDWSCGNSAIRCKREVRGCGRSVALGSTRGCGRGRNAECCPSPSGVCVRADLYLCVSSTARTAFSSWTRSLDQHSSFDPRPSCDVLVDTIRTAWGVHRSRARPCIDWIIVKGVPMLPTLSTVHCKWLRSLRGTM